MEIIIQATDLASPTIARVITQTDALGRNGLATGMALVTLGLGLEAVAASLGKMAEEGAKFEAMINKVANNTPMATNEIAQMRQGLLDLGTETGVVFDKLGEGFQVMESITGDVATAMAILEVATKSAVSTGGDAAATALILGNALHEYGMDAVFAADGTRDMAKIQENAAHMMGVFTVAANEGNVTLEQFAQFSGRAIGVAANLGVSAEDVASAFASLTLHGFDAAQAGTQMTNILTHMINPTVAAAKEIKRISDLTGIDLVRDFSAAGLHSKGLEGVLADLSLAYQRLGLTQAEAEQESLKLINAQRGGLGLAILLGTGYDDYRRILADMNDQTRVNTITEEQFNRTQETAVFQWQRLHREIQATAIVIGTQMLPLLTPLLVNINSIIEGFRAWIATHQELAGRLAVITMLVTGGIGALLLLAGAITIVNAALAPLLPILAGIAGVLTGPLGIALAVAGLAVVAYKNNWLGLGDAVREAVGAARAEFDKLRAAFDTGGIGAVFAALGQQLAPLRDHFDALVARARDLATHLRDLLAPALAFVQDHFLIVTSAIGIAISAMLGVPLVIIGILTALKLLAVAWLTDWGGIREKTEAVVSAIGTFLHDIAIPALLAMGVAVREHLVAAWDTAKGATSAALDTIGGAFAALGTAFDGFVQHFEPFLTMLGVGLVTATTTVFGALGNLWAQIATGSGIGAELRIVWASLVATAQTLASAIGPLVALMGEEFGQALRNVGVLMSILGTEVRNFVTITSTAFQLLGTILNSMGITWEHVGRMAEFFAKVVLVNLVVGLGLLTTALGAVIGLLGGTLPGVFQVVIGIVQVFVGIVQAFVAVTVGAFKIVIDLLRGDWHQAWADAQQALHGWTAGMETALHGVGQIFRGILNSMIGSVAGFLSGAGLALLEYFNAILVAATSKGVPGFDAMKRAITELQASSGHLGDELINHVVPGTIAAANGLDNAGASAGRAGGNFSLFNPALTAAQAVLQNIRDAAIASAAAINQAGDAVKTTSGHMQGFAPSTNLAADAIQRLRDAANPAAAAIRDMALAALNALGVTDNMGKAVRAAAGGFDVAASSVQLAQKAIDAYDRALQELGTEHGHLSGYLRTLQAEWNMLDAATKAQGFTTDAQRAAYARLAPSIEYLNAQMGVNQTKTIDATLAAIGQQQATDNARAAAVAGAIQQVAYGNALSIASAFTKAHTQTTGDTTVAINVAREATTQLIAAFKSVPSKVITDVTTPGLDDANGGVQNYIGTLAGIPRSVTTTINTVYTTSGSPAQAALSVAGFRASGGPVTAGVPYVVGDGGGPEIFVPQQSGTILPFGSAPRTGGGGGGGDTYITLQVQGSVVTERDLIETVYTGLLRKKRAMPSLSLS